ncbi:MAG TPA: PQQ-dependent sugar dehydrogenase [Anaerolineae bacterium]|nr:PQQ-dependent sugar dehydrogenase [Anaerolineae bacterium]
MQKACLTLLAIGMCSGCTPRSSATAGPTQPPMISTAQPTAPGAPTLSPTETAIPLPTDTPIPTHPPAPPVVERGRVPEGFSLIVVAERLPRLTTLAFGPDGALYAGLRQDGIIRLTDAAGDHRYETRTEFAPAFDELLGLAWRGDTLYVSYRGAISTLRDTDRDGVADARSDIVTDLPVGRHQNNSLVFGPDNRLYLPLGSTCDACVETDPRSASILSFAPDGGDARIIAGGLRNAYDLAFDAQGNLFATENGRDDLGDTLPPEELNHIVPGSNYGWPDCWGVGQGSGCDGARAPVAEFDARSSADGLVFYLADQFPPEYRGNAFVALWGSYIVATRPRVMRVQLSLAGDTFAGQVSDFATGLGRPLDLVVGPEGALYIADYEAEAIFRVTYGAP